MDPIGEEVGRELGRLGPEAAVGELARAWPEAVGDVIARNAWPLRVGRDGTLHVATSSSSWAFELAQLAPTLLERLRGALGPSAPRAARFAPGPLPSPPAPAGDSARAQVPDPTEAELEAARELTAAVGDEELRDLLARAAAASLASRRASPRERTADRPV